MRCVMHGINERKRAGFVCEANNFIHWIDSTNGVRGVSGSDEFRPWRDLAAKIIHVECAVCFADVHLAYYDPNLFKRTPRSHIAVVIQSGDYDLVARFQVAADSARERKSKRRHVGAEKHFVGRTIEKIRHCRARGCDHLVGSAASEELAHRVCIRRLKVLAKSVDHALRNLRACRSIEKCGGMSVHSELQRRKLRSHPVDIEWSRRRLLCGRCVHWELVVYDGFATARMKSPSSP